VLAVGTAALAVLAVGTALALGQALGQVLVQALRQMLMLALTLTHHSSNRILYTTISSQMVVVSSHVSDPSARHTLGAEGCRSVLAKRM